MASRELRVPAELISADPGVYGDIDAFMDSYESGAQYEAYTRMAHFARETLELTVKREVRFYSNNTPPERYDID